MSRPSPAERLSERLLGRGLVRDAVLVVLLPILTFVGGGLFGAHFTTRTVEEIKAQIASESWVQQNRWTLKRDVYTRLFESLDEFRDAVASQLFHFDEWKKAEAAEKKNAQLIASLRRATSDHLDRAERANQEIRRALSVAAIMLSPEALASLRDFARQWRQVEGLPDPGEGMRRQAEAAASAHRLLVPLAKRDLFGDTK